MIVSRWAPDARERLEAAALDLFVENGYEETTVAQIAERAGLNRATFFRHFAEKREVLFGGEDVLAGLFADAIRAASPNATLTECLQAAFAAADVAMTPQQRAKAAQRVLVVVANSELQERGLLKHARIAGSMSGSAAALPSKARASCVPGIWSAARRQPTSPATRSPANRTWDRARPASNPPFAPQAVPDCGHDNNS